MRPITILSPLLATLLLLPSAQAGTKPKPAPKAPVPLPLTPRERTLQLLNRFTFGPRPGELDQVLAQGPYVWFDQQLNPAAIPDKGLDKRLGDYPTLTLKPEQLLSIFPDRGVIQQVADGKRPYPTDPLQLSVLQVAVLKLHQEQDQRKLLESKTPQPEPTEAQKADQKKTDQATAARIAGQLFSLPRNQRMAALNAMPPEDRATFAANLAGDQRNTLNADFTPREREALLAMQAGAGGSAYRNLDELAQAKLLREVLSERQVQEVMTDFWFNHFNIYFNKDSDQWYTSAYERDSIRPNALGKFRDLLLATAQSPAMMVYLDNWLSVGPNSQANGVNPQKPNVKPGNKGLNENYGREIMELHTVGVNGGYSQADVTHLSTILTGWSVDKPNQAGPFQFDPRKHEPGTKTWFGYTIDEQGRIVGSTANVPAATLAAVTAGQANTPDGMRQGKTALILLASMPQTAHFISFLLAQRFVADVPPPALVDRLARTYTSSDGDIKAVLHALVASPEFNSRQFFRTKVKTPNEFLASAFRVTATDPINPGALLGKIRELGEPPYQALPPTGYYITADHWMNTGALVARLNFADQLTHNHFANQKFDASRVLAFGLLAERNPQQSPGKARELPISVDTSSDTPGPDVALHVLETTLIGGGLSPNTDRYIHTQLAQQPVSAPGDTLNLLTALLLGSPEFQLR